MLKRHTPFCIGREVMVELMVVHGCSPESLRLLVQAFVDQEQRRAWDETEAKLYNM